MDMPNGLDMLWAEMHQEKGTLVRRTENYARLTLPYICPPDNSDMAEQTKGDVAIGPRLVNHLSNKVVDTMFPHDRPNFTVGLTPEAKRNLRKEVGEGKEADVAEGIRLATSEIEQAAMRKMNLVAYRPQAVEAVKHMIIAGNALIKRTPKNKRIVYGVKDYCVRRDIEGDCIEALLKDSKRFGGLPTNLRNLVRARQPKIKDNDVVVLYSHYKRTHDGRWAYQQGVDGHLLATISHFTAEDVPILALTWTLARGANYGRGLVEDQIVAFHNVDVSSVAMVEMIGIMADIKNLVDPASLLDVEELNNSPRGSYHQGRKDDISTPQGQRSVEIGTIKEVIQSWERELANAFLLSSGGIRDAERVTAEEIRAIARELESAYGGLYSRLATEWQFYEATYAMRQVNFKQDIGGNVDLFEVTITTGLESLSREGQLANLRAAISDLTMYDAVPDEVRATINPSKFASFVFTNHTVRLAEFMFSKEEMQANKKAEQDAMQQQTNMETGAKVQQAAGAKAMQE